MASVHLFHMESLKNTFNGNIQTLHSILDKQIFVREKLKELKTNYDYMVQNNKKKIFLFCLDSYYFQYKTLVLETENIDKYIAMIKNRMYGDYYKLFQLIVNEMNGSMPIEEFVTKQQKYTPYKEIEPYYEYNQADVLELHQDILKVLNLMYKEYLQKEKKVIENNKSGGLYVENFIQTLNFENNVFKEKILLYVGYLHFYHKLQEKYLTGLFRRVDMFYKDVEENVITNGNMNSNDETKRQIEEYLSKEPLAQINNEPIVKNETLAPKKEVIEPKKEVIEPKKEATEPKKEVVEENIQIELQEPEIKE
jgi:hypothetical protein